MINRELENIVESFIFASPDGVGTAEITRCVRTSVATARARDGELAPEWITRFAKVDENQVREAIAKLNTVYEETGRAFMLVERPAGWRIMSRADFSPWVRELFPEKKPSRLTPSALETLAIIAYRQPVTKGSIEAVRGVSVDGPLQALLDRNVVRIAGRAELPGRPLLYETTDTFLDHFGIRNVDELPNAAELRNVKLPEPEPATPAAPAAPEGEVKAGTETEAAPTADSPAEAGEGTPSPEGGEAKPKRKPRAKKEKPVAAAAPDEPAVPETATVPADETAPPEEPAPEREASPGPEKMNVKVESADEEDEVEEAPEPAPAAPRPAPVAPVAEWSPPDEEEPESEFEPDGEEPDPDAEDGDHEDEGADGREGIRN